MLKKNLHTKVNKTEVLIYINYIFLLYLVIDNYFVKFVKIVNFGYHIQEVVGFKHLE